MMSTTPSRIDPLFRDVAARVAAASAFALQLRDRLSANAIAASALAKAETTPGAFFFDIGCKVEQGVKTSGIESVELKSYLAEGFVLVNHTPGVVECKVTTVKFPKVLYEQVFKLHGSEPPAPDATSVADEMTRLLVMAA